MSKVKLGNFFVIILFLSHSFIYTANKDIIKEANQQLLEAIHKKDFEGIKQSIKNGSNVNITDRAGWTPLMTISKDSSNSSEYDINIINLLLENGANVNAKSHYGMTPLLAAARSGQTEILVTLLLAGADINHKDDEGETAYDLAKSHNHFGTAAVLEAWPEIKKTMKEDITLELDEGNILLSDLNKIVSEYVVGS